jgi:hypothetical protein
MEKKMTQISMGVGLEDMPPNWLDKHSVNCYFCGELVDERECIPADEYNNNDGGDICPECLKEIQRRDEKNGLYPDKWDDCN